MESGASAGDRRRALAWTCALVAAAAALRMPLVLADASTQLSLLPDDASYYMEAARRTVESGAWPSMDGRHATSGFHPLHMALQIALQLAVGTSTPRVVALTLAISLALNVAAVALVARACSRRRADAAALAAGAAFALSPGWLAHGIAGLENGLVALLVAIAALRWWSRFGDARGGARRAWTVDGLLLGLAMLARTDACLFAAAYLASALALRGREAGLRVAAREVAAAGAAAALVVAPWLVALAARFGSIVQDSAAVIPLRLRSVHGEPGSAGWLALVARNLAIWAYRYAWTWGALPLTAWIAGALAPSPLRPARAPRWLAWGVVALSVASLGARANDPWRIDDERAAAVEIALALGGFAAGLATPCSLSPRGRAARAAAIAYAGGMALAYGAVFLGFQLWYVTAPALVVLGLACAPRLAELVRGRPLLAAAIVALVAAHGIDRVRRYRSDGAFEPMQPELLAERARIRDAILGAPEEERSRWRLGAFDSGEWSWTLHPVPVTNLDGVMNHAAREALSRGAFAEWLRRDGITHVIGARARIEEFRRLGAFDVELDRALGERIGVRLYRIVP